MVKSSVNFIAKDLNRYENQNHLCFSYTPDDNLKVHNASILGAGLIARYSKTVNINSYNDLLIKCFNYINDYQNKDGSWHYAETNYQSWIDSFHTGFNLFSLQYIYDHINDKKILDTIVSGKLLC